MANICIYVLNCFFVNVKDDIILLELLAKLVNCIYCGVTSYDRVYCSGYLFGDFGQLETFMKFIEGQIDCFITDYSELLVTT